MDEVAWNRFDASKLDPELVPLVKAAAMVERNGTDYAVYLNRVFADDPDFRQAADHWAEEEVQHGDALGRWAMLADPSWDYEVAFARYRAGYKLPLDATASIRGSRTGELIARCMVETGTSSYYSALAEAAAEPVLRQICKNIAADEFRHYKLFYDHMRRYLAREKIGLARRLRIALGRIGESEDDELAFAWHCGNQPELRAIRTGRLHGGVYGAGDAVLSLPPRRAWDGHGVQGGRHEAARTAVGCCGEAGLAAAALAAAAIHAAAMIPTAQTIDFWRHCSPRVMAGEGRPPTALLYAAQQSRGWPAFAGHDTGGAVPPRCVTLSGVWYEFTSPASRERWTRSVR